MILVPSMKVIKIGGGCLKDGHAAGKIIELIAERGRGNIFVLSAFYGVTNILLDGIQKALEDENEIARVMTRLKTMHNSIIKCLIPDISTRKQLSRELLPVFRKLERCYYGISFTREATPRMQDMIATFGERISAVILAKTLGSMGEKTCVLMPETAGIISDGRFGDASAMMEETSRNLKSAVSSAMTLATIFFVPGFYGVSKGGDITTFGRGGSDYSAAVVAAALEADVLEIWKDTPGFMTADPDNIPHCRLIPELTYEEAAELAYTGAGILHPRTVEPVRKAGINIAIKNTYSPDDPGSLITCRADNSGRIIKSVSYTTDIAVVKIHASGVGARSGILSRITGELTSSDINIKSVVTSQTCISIMLSKNDIARAHKKIEKIRPVLFREISCIIDVALVSIVGEGLQANKGIAAKCFSAVSDAGVNIEMISFGASNAALYFLVREDRLDTTINALHNIFFD
jgi:aspartate kinase